MQRQYDEYWSGDPAFVQRDATWTDQQKAEHDNKIRIARETGDWMPLLVEGMQPTKFIMRALPGKISRKLVDDINFGKIGSAVLASVSFRAAILSIENGPSDLPAITQVQTDYGPIASTDISDALDALALEIVGELGSVVLARARGPSPKP